MRLTDKYIWNPISSYLQRKVEEVEKEGSELIEYNSVEDFLEE